MKQHDVFASFATTTRLVLFGRGFLWLMIVAVIGLIFYSAMDEQADDHARLMFSNIKQVGSLQNIMKNPHYHGLDKDNLPYSVTADKATQQDADTVFLEKITADMETKQAKWLAMRAGAGVLKIASKQLTLTKNVDMFYDGGYEFRSDHAFVDIANGTASGDAPVTGQAPMGTLQANSFFVMNRGEVIRFNGNVKVVIYRE